MIFIKAKFLQVLHSVIYCIIRENYCLSDQIEIHFIIRKQNKAYQCIFRTLLRRLNLLNFLDALGIQDFGKFCLKSSPTYMLNITHYLFHRIQHIYCEFLLISEPSPHVCFLNFSGITIFWNILLLKQFTIVNSNMYS